MPSNQLANNMNEIFAEDTTIFLTSDVIHMYNWLYMISKVIMFDIKLEIYLKELSNQWKANNLADKRADGIPQADSSHEPAVEETNENVKNALQRLQQVKKHNKYTHKVYPLHTHCIAQVSVRISAILHRQKIVTSQGNPIQPYGDITIIKNPTPRKSHLGLIKIKETLYFSFN